MQQISDKPHKQLNLFPSDLGLLGSQDVRLDPGCDTIDFFSSFVSVALTATRFRPKAMFPKVAPTSFKVCSNNKQCWVLLGLVTGAGLIVEAGWPAVTLPHHGKW